MIRLAYHPASYLRQSIPIEDALADIAAAGWDGFEWSWRALSEHFRDARHCRERLEELGLRLSGIYHACMFLTDGEIEEWIEQSARAIDFAGSVGCGVLMIDGGSTELPVNAESIQRVADAADSVGEMAADSGLICTWHQHWGTLFQYAAEFDALMDATDSTLLHCTLDTAHLALGGFDIPATFRRFADRLRYVHFKDLSPDRRFANLGEGIVEFDEPVRILVETEFDGWIVNDLDYTDNDPRVSSRHNLRFLQKLLTENAGDP